jgi:RNA recognition motif-containing protein
VKIINRDGLSMGYGFVEFATPADAQKALIRK